MQEEEEEEDKEKNRKMETFKPLKPSWSYNGS